VWGFSSRTILGASDENFRKEEGHMAITLQRGVANEGFVGLTGVLMMKEAALTESKLLSLSLFSSFSASIPRVLPGQILPRNGGVVE
jgi:hypothetical protein